MEQQNVTPTAPQSTAPMTKKLAYEPPRATFVPLKLEERLLTCVSTNVNRPCAPNLAS